MAQLISLGSSLDLLGSSGRGVTAGRLCHAEVWGELAHPHLALPCVLGWGNLETKGVCSSWSSGLEPGAFLAQCPAGLIPGSCSRFL